MFQTSPVADTDITRIWHMINAADKYLFDTSILCGFFDLWYAKNINLSTLQDDMARQVALPCYMFDHAVGFAEVTKWLAYNHKGHITEQRPNGFKWTHVRLAPPEFVGYFRTNVSHRLCSLLARSTGPMNHARRALRTTIYHGIWHRIGKLLENGISACKCGK